MPELPSAWNGALLDLIPSMVVLLDEDLRIVAWNQACTLNSGYSLAEVQGKPFAWLFESHAAPLFLSFQQTDRLYLRNHTNTGSWGRWSYTTLRDSHYTIATGVALRAQCDGTELLHQSESRLAAIVSLAADAVIALDRKQRMIFFNEGAEEIFGYSYEEALGKPLDILLPDRYRSIHQNHIQHFSAGQDMSRRMGERREVVARRRSGEEFPAEAAISTRHVNGEQVLTVVLRDNTHRKNLEIRLQFLADIGVMLAAAREDFLLVRQALERSLSMLGPFAAVAIFHGEALEIIEAASLLAEKDAVLRELRRFLEQHCRELLSVTSAESAKPLVLHSIPSHEVGVEEHLGATQLSLLVVPLVAREKVFGVSVFLSFGECCVFSDDEKWLAEQLSARLATAVDNVLLYQEARRATKLRDDVLLVVAHDLRNPLTAVRLLLEKQPSTQETALMLRATQHIDRLVQDLLDVSKLASGYFVLVKQAMSAEELLQEMLSQMNSMAEGREIVREGLVPLPNGCWDRERIQQVLMNLFCNAKHFTSSNARISLGGELVDGDIVFFVSDTGIGIAEEYLPHLFEPFWQGRAANRHGAGLGLSICKGIVEAHGGTIWAESKLGKGSTFRFRLPR